MSSNINTAVSHQSCYNSTYDDEEYRLPDGFERVGYDADTNEYYFESRGGALYKTLPGNRLSKMIPASFCPGTFSKNQQPGEDGDGNKHAWRSMLPFFVLVVLFLLFMMSSISWPHGIFGGGGGGGGVQCGDGLLTHIVRQGDTCWSLVEEYGTGFDTLKDLNPNLDCDSLQVGRKICVPFHES